MLLMRTRICTYTYMTNMHTVYDIIINTVFNMDFNRNTWLQ